MFAGVYDVELALRVEAVCSKTVHRSVCQKLRMIICTLANKYDDDGCVLACVRTRLSAAPLSSHSPRTDLYSADGDVCRRVCVVCYPPCNVITRVDGSLIWWVNNANGAHMSQFSRAMLSDGIRCVRVRSKDVSTSDFC